MKNNYVRALVFCLIFILLIEVLTWVFLPSSHIEKYGTIKVGKYDILSEEENTIDAVIVGDSLVYSSLSPMQLWHQKGYTIFDSSEAAQIIPAAYDQVDIAIKSQHPKIIMLEANVLFRNPKKRKIKNTLAHNAKQYVPIARYHNTWKKYLSDGSKKNWVNESKGYKFIEAVEPSVPKKYMIKTSKHRPIPKDNIEWFNKIIKKCNDNDVKFILISFATQRDWNYSKHNTIEDLASKYNIEFIDLNLEDIGINWITDTKDKGVHLNYKGAKKVTTYIGNYLEKTGLMEDHRNDPKYKSWNKAYKRYISDSYHK